MHVIYPRARCTGCLRFIATKKGHCRLCWLQAGILAEGKPRITAQDFRPGSCRQLSLAGLTRLGHPEPLRTPTETVAAQPVPSPAGTGQMQLKLFPLGASRLSGKRHWVASTITGEALDLTRRIAAELAGIRGWSPRIVLQTDRALAVVLAEHDGTGLITWSDLSPALQPRDLSVTRTAEILALAGLLDDDRVASFTHLKQTRLAALPPAMAADIEHWLHARQHGGPRSRPRDEHTVRMNLNRVQPLLLDWAGRYSHLREVTATDVLTAIHPLTGSRRRQTFTALRSLFRHCRKTGRIFRDPTTGITSSLRPLNLLQPLEPADFDQATAAATTPAARLALALAAVHAARPKSIRELHLQDIDLGNRRLTITGTTRPLDDLTRTLLQAWLAHRSTRWPGTANPHLIINQQTATTTRAVSENWLTSSCRGLTATLERLRMDRELDEALTHDADPLHLAAMFGIDDTTALRYAAIARTLQHTPTEQHDLATHEPKDPNPP